MNFFQFLSVNALRDFSTLRPEMETFINSEGSFPPGKATPSNLIWIKKPRAVLKLVRNGKP